MADPAYDIVFIRDLTLEMSVGIYEREKKDKQRVIVNMEMRVTPPGKKRDFHIEDVVSYEDIAQKIESLAGQKHYDLLEEFAEKIAKECLQDKKIMSLTIRLEKPDIMEKTASVGIQITRGASNSTLLQNPEYAQHSFSRDK